MFREYFGKRLTHGGLLSSILVVGDDEEVNLFKELRKVFLLFKHLEQWRVFLALMGHRPPGFQMFPCFSTPELIRWLIARLLQNIRMC